MIGIATYSTAKSTYKFDNFSLVENGLVLIKNNKEKTTISFSELDKIYIKKYKFRVIDKVGLLAILLLLTAISSQYLPIEIVFLTVILFVPLTVKLNAYKRYQLNILHNNGAFFIKNIKNDSKHDHINLVQLVRNKIFYNRVELDFYSQTTAPNELKRDDYNYSNLSIA
jgi:hypothetical protein